MCGLSGEFLLRFLLLNLVYFENNFVICEEPSNAVFNTNIRKYSVKEDDVNATDVKTLQKDEIGRYASFAPIRNPIRYKEIPDNALSSSSYGRGLLHHEHAGHEGYGLHEHEGFYGDDSHYGHGFDYGHGDHHHEFSHHDDHHHDDHHHDDHHHDDHHGHGHHYGHHHIGHGHHHKHHDHHHKHYDHHHLATKAILWPIAGIALLGAAAALVTNPVLLQLGVVSGRRKRRDTAEVSDPDFSNDWPLDPYSRSDETKHVPRKVTGHKKVREKKVSHTFPGHVKPKNQVNNRFIPIPLKLKGD